VSAKAQCALPTKDFLECLKEDMLDRVNFCRESGTDCEQYKRLNNLAEMLNLCVLFTQSLESGCANIGRIGKHLGPQGLDTQKGVSLVTSLEAQLFLIGRFQEALSIGKSTLIARYTSAE
jgi:hypothetical protein